MAGWNRGLNQSPWLSRMRSALHARSAEIHIMAGLLVVGGVYFTLIPPPNGQQPLFLALGAAALIAGTGIWFFQKWARWVALGVFAILYGLFIVRTFAVEFHIGRVFGIVFGLWTLWGLWTLDIARAGESGDDSEDPSDDSDNRPLISLVALLREPRFLDCRSLAAAANRAWETNLPAGDEAEDHAHSFVVGESPLFVVQDEDWMFIVHNHDRPYFDDPEAASETIPEMRAQRAVADHKAWMAVDLMRKTGDDAPDPETAGPDNPFRRIGRLLSELIDDDCLAVLYPDGGILEPYSEEVHEKLRSDDPLGELRRISYAPVIQIAPDDPRMQAAVAEAKDRWPEFVAAFEQRRPEQNFGVKAPITDGENTEFMWLAVTAIENDVIYGTLNNEPVAVAKKYLNQRLSIPLSDLNDWMYVADNEMHGGFTMKVLMDHYKEQHDEEQ
jgi:uncharacterized protein YegJ (DUF2314 family)